MTEENIKKESNVKNFALVGAGGYVAPRHMKAIRDTGNILVSALDRSDSVGILDSFSYDISFFTEFERFDRHAEKLRRQGEDKRLHYVSICSPNYLHDAHIRFALRIGADAICEKPLVLNPWNLDALDELENETGRKIYNILQLRVHPSIIALKEKVANASKKKKYEVSLTYMTTRGRWYSASWKGDPAKSGGVATNIGVHFFDMLLWVFGEVKHYEVHLADESKMAGFLELERANIRWYLSIDKNDLPQAVKDMGKPTFRSITLDGEEFEFSDGFTDLHTEVYRQILGGKGYGIEDARAAINLVYELRNAKVTVVNGGCFHPVLNELGRGKYMPEFFVHTSSFVDEGAEVGKGTKIWHFSHVMSGAKIGERCIIGQNCVVSSGVVIGSNVKVQNNVSIYEGTIVEDDVFLGPSCVLTNVTNPRSQVLRRSLYEKTLLRRGCSIGANATVVCGITIGRYAFVAAGAVVAKDVPDYALMIGVPARQKGWMSRHGHILKNADENGVMICPESKLLYKEVQKGVLRCLDLDEESPLPEELAIGKVIYDDLKISHF